jgi:hypothetical protein
MRNSRKGALVAITLAAAWTSNAHAQQQAQGFAVERFYPSAPGGGWLVMDTLDMRGGIGGAAGLTISYAHDPLRIATTNGSQHLTVVSDEALADFGFAATYGRFRLYLNLDAPLVMSGQSGTVGDYSFTAPTGNPSATPDALADARVGFDARLAGDAKSAFRLGAGAQLYVPFTGDASNYLTDGTYRAMGRLLFAGDVGSFTYAAQLGVHIRPRDDAPAPGPQGSELLFGVAAGARIAVPGLQNTSVIVGPEVYGASAFRSFLGTDGTALEGLLSGRLEGTADDGRQYRLKLGVGAGLNPHFGEPEWRFVIGIELFDHSTDRDKDGVFDSKDACPDVPGVKTKDASTNGCPVEPGGDATPGSAQPAKPE